MPVDAGGWAPVIPELIVTDFATSLAFWTEYWDSR